MAKRKRSRARGFGLRDRLKKALRKIDAANPATAPNPSPAKPGRLRRMGAATVKVEVGRDTTRKGHPVFACASIGGGGRFVTECVTSRNPRLATAGALRKVANKIARRSGGALQGLGCFGRRRRRRRRR